MVNSMVTDEKVVQTEVKEYYCCICRSRTNFKFNDPKSCHTESGKVFLVGYKCLVCGNIIYPKL
jgi:hypothetical protein